MKTAVLNAAVLALSLALPVSAEMRKWKNAQGREVEAEFKGSDGTNVILKLANGSEVPVPLAKLSPADQAYVKAQAASQPSADNVPPAAQRVWPDSVEASRSAVEVKLTESNEGARRYVYRSEGFEFTSQANLLPGLMKSVAQTFEATRRLVAALPWGITPRPPEGAALFNAALFETRDDYIAAGGPANSGGVYMTDEKIFKIPFPSLGIERRGQSYARSENYSSDTLVHEITHQLMHDYLQHLPTWVIEGTAEYTEMLPYNGGKFRVSGAESGLKEYLENFGRRGLAPSLPDLASFIRMTRDSWQAKAAAGRMPQLYQQSAILVYFFNHLDGDGKGLSFMKYMDAKRAQIAKWKDYFKAVEVYRKQMDEFFKLPGVKRLDGGRFSYAQGLTPPKPPEPPDGDEDGTKRELLELDILIAGRPLEQLQQELQEKMNRIHKGIRPQVIP